MVQSNHINASFEISSKLEADSAGHMEQDARTRLFVFICIETGAWIRVEAKN